MKFVALHIHRFGTFVRFFMAKRCPSDSEFADWVNKIEDNPNFVELDRADESVEIFEIPKAGVWPGLLLGKSKKGV